MQYNPAGKKAREIEISAVDPVASMTAVENPGLVAIAHEIKIKLSRIIESL